RAGTPLPFDASTASAYLKNNRDVSLRLRFTLGPGRCTMWTCDLTYEYVRLNAEYTTQQRATLVCWSAWRPASFRSRLPDSSARPFLPHGTYPSATSQPLVRDTPGAVQCF